MSRFTRSILISAAIAAVSPMFSCDSGGGVGGVGVLDNPSETNTPIDPSNTNTSARPAVNPDSAFSQFSNGWFDKLTDAVKGNIIPGDVLSTIKSKTAQTANQRNLRDLAEAFHGISPSTSTDLADPDPATALRNTLIAHVDAIQSHKFRGEFKLGFSKSKKDVSAAASFFSLVEQAVNYSA